MIEEFARPTFDYSPEQWAAIDKALAALDLPEERIKSAHLNLILASSPTKPFSIVKAMPNQIEMHEEIMASLDRTMQMIGWMDDQEYYEDEGRWLPHEMAKHVIAARAALLPIWLHSDRQAKHLRATMDELRADAPPEPGPNFKWYQDKLFRRVAQIWTDRGGSINHGDLYRAFFESAVKPPFFNRQVRDITRCQWSENLFKHHVEKMQRELGIDGTRGPSRNSKLANDEP
jgi:hypothetical protein